MLVRLGQVHLERQDWEAAKAALDRGIGKGKLNDAGGAQLLMGIAFFNEKKFADARPWFERAAKADKHRSIAETYLQIIDAQTAQSAAA